MVLGGTPWQIDQGITCSVDFTLQFFQSRFYVFDLHKALNSTTPTLFKILSSDEIQQSTH